MRRLCAGWIVCAGLSMVLCGCGLFPEETSIDDTIRIEHYEPVQHNVVKVKRGDLDESVTVNAFYTYVTEKDYYLKYAGDPEQWGMEIRNYVEIGDIVKKGELLAEAPCEELEQQLMEYQSQAEEIEQTLAYNRKLLKMAEDADKPTLQDAVKDSEGQLSVANARIAETKAKIADYRIYADMDGQVTYVADAYMIGSYNAQNRYITVASFEGVFRGEIAKGIEQLKGNNTDSAKKNNTAVTLTVQGAGQGNDGKNAVVVSGQETSEQTESDVDNSEESLEEDDNRTQQLKEGDTYPALIEDAEVTLTVQSIEQGDDGKSEIVFRSEQEYPERTKAKVQISGEKRSNVLYIPESAVTIVEQKAYVLVMEKDGFARLREVKVSGPVADNYIIEDGLEEGEEVINE